jgi:hypothetical protein
VGPDEYTLLILLQMQNAADHPPVPEVVPAEWWC